jgi:hypothetical protein
MEVMCVMCRQNESRFCFAAKLFQKMIVVN